jgi:transcriptional regulator with XRE-family HTH domain
MLFKEKIIEQIKKVMEDKNITTYRMCKDLGISEGNLSRFFSGKENISLDRLKVILDYLELTDVILIFKDEE